MLHVVLGCDDGDACKRRGGQIALEHHLREDLMKHQQLAAAEPVLRAVVDRCNREPCARRRASVQRPLLLFELGSCVDALAMSAAEGKETVQLL